jgi:hypothetical protein
MDGVALLADAKAASLTVRVDGDLLVIRGPRAADTTARMLLAYKPEVIAALSVRQFIDQAAKLSAGGTLRQRPRPALSPVPLTALYTVQPGEEWLADGFYPLRNRSH